MKQILKLEKIFLLNILLSIFPIIISCIFIYFMPAEVPLHYDFKGNINRWGSGNEMILLACIFSVFPLSMSLIFYKTNMHTNLKLIGQLSAIIMSLVFIFLQIYFILKIFKITGINTQFVSWVSFAITIIGILYLLLAFIIHFLPLKKFVNKNIQTELDINKSKKILTLVLGVGGLIICITGALIKSIYSLIPFCICTLSILTMILYFYKKSNKKEI